jgi:FdhD protein
MAPQFQLTCAPLAPNLDLAVGFLFTEGIIDDVGQILSMNAESEEDSTGKSSDRVTIRLRPEVAIDRSRIRRNFYTSSSCGVCGRLAGAIEIRPQRPMRQSGPQFRADVIYREPGLLRQAQNAFDRTVEFTPRRSSRPKVFCSVCLKTWDDTTRSTN